jgi:hypothetical protein
MCRPRFPGTEASKVCSVIFQKWCRGPESNWLRPPFQGGALPVSYPGTVESVNFRGDCTECQSKCAEFLGHPTQKRPKENRQAISASREGQAVGAADAQQEARRMRRGAGRWEFATVSDPADSSRCAERLRDICNRRVRNSGKARVPGSCKTRVRASGEACSHDLYDRAFNTSHR